MSPSIPGPWKGSQTLFYGPGSQTHHMSAAFPSRLNQTTLCSVKCFVFVCCQDHYVVQCVVRKRSRPWAPLVPTRPPFTTCWPRSSSHHGGPCGAHSSHQPQLRAEKALLAHTKHMTKAFFFAKKDFLSVGPALLLGSGVIVHPGQKKRGRGGLEENSTTLLSKNSFIPVSRRSPPLRVQEARSASRLPQWHKGELVTTGFHIVVSFVWILESVGGRRMAPPDPPSLPAAKIWKI